MGIMTIKERRTRAASDDYWYGTVAQAAASGIEVTPEMAIKNTAFWNGVNIISGTMAVFPCHLMKRKPGGGTEHATNRPLYRKLKLKPNPWQTASQWKQQLQYHQLVHGNAIVQKVYNRAGQIDSLVPLLPQRTRLKVSWDGDITYTYQPGGGRPERIFKQEEILHLRGLSSDGLVGYSPVLTMKEAIGLSIATEMYGAKFFSQGTRPPGALQSPNKIEPTAKKNIAKSWLEAYSGQKGWHKVAILDEGLEFKSLGMTSEEAQMIGTRTFQVGEVARMLNLHTHMLKDTSGPAAGYNSIVQMFLEYAVVTMTPWVVLWEESLMTALLTPAEQEQYIIKFSMEGLLRGDPETRGKFYQIMTGLGAFSPNDILALEDRNPIGAEGDRRFISVQYLPLEAEVVTPEPSPEGAGRGLESRSMRSIGLRQNYQKSYSRVLREAGARIVSRETRALRRMIKSELGERSVGSLKEKFAEFFPKQQQYVSEQMRGPLMAYAEVVSASAAEEIGAESGMTEEMERFVSDYSDTMAIRHVESSQGQLEALIEENQGEELSEVLNTRLDEWEEKRPDKIGLRESVQAGAAIAIATYMANGIKRKVWVCGPSACPICLRLSGKTVEITGSFASKGDVIDPDDGETAPLEIHRDFGHPQLHEGCMCGVSAAY